jgi:exopolysaccharide biosynthesis WecB/TagA/CpsF family protein
VYSAADLSLTTIRFGPLHVIPNHSGTLSQFNEIIYKPLTESLRCNAVFVAARDRSGAMTNIPKSKATAPSPPPADIAPSRLIQASVDGWTVNIPTLEVAISQVIGAARAADSFTCFTLNLDHLVKLREDTRFQSAYRAARFVTADGEPVARIARRQWPSVRRTTGADMMLPLCEAAAQNDLPVYLFGTSTEVLESTITRLAEITGGRLRIAGYEAPPYGFDPQSPASDACVDRIAASGARLCLVLLGAPKQEIFAARAVERGVECGFICLGASADFVAGHQVRAPRALQTAGLEWAWRLANNPRRLGMRYARCAMLLASIEMNGRKSDRRRDAT